LEENARGATERVGIQMTQAADTVTANFTERTNQVAREQFEVLNARANSAFEMNIGRLESNAVEICSKLERDARMLAGDFQHALSQQTQQSLVQGRQELASEIELAKNSLRIEAESLDRQTAASVNSLGTHAMDEYKNRLDNASNSWLLTTVTRLTQHSEELIEHLAGSAEKRLHQVCGGVFAEIGETLRQRLAGLSPATAATASPLTTPIASARPEDES
jgi:hypothetical protein